MITVTGLKTCDTCRRALKELTAAGRPARLRDLRAEPPQRSEIIAWHGLFGDSLLNSRSTTWRGLTDTERSGDPIDLMIAHPALIKRPVIERLDGPTLLGWTAETKSALDL